MARRTLFLIRAVCCCLALYGLPAMAQTVTQEEIAQRFAPVLVQGEPRDPNLARYDIPTNADFAGDFDALKSWKRASIYPMKAYAYKSVLETKTHYFIAYCFFYPRDWKGRGPETRIADFIHHFSSVLDPTRVSPEIEFAHENDFEGVLVAVAKDPQPHAIIMESLAHSRLHLYATEEFLAAHPHITGAKKLYLVGGRPIVVSKSKGHGDVSPECAHPKQFRVFTYAGIAEDPQKTDTLEVGYGLLDIKRTFWDMQEPDARTFFAKRHDYSRITVPVLEGGEVRTVHVEKKMVGTNIRGHVGMPNAARMPWKWEGITGKRLLHFRFRFRRNEMRHGEWFLDPAMVVGRHFKLSEKECSRVYLSHPYAAMPRETAVNSGTQP